MENEINNGNQGFFSKDYEGTRIIYGPSDNIEIMIDSETDEIIQKLFLCKDIKKV